MYQIYLVEDDVRIRGELKTLLEKYGYGCIWSDDFKNIADDILCSGCHLVLLDINLPYFDGFHVCREIRKQSSIPIIVVTSRDTESDELMSMNLGADDFVTKPYNTQILLARIESLLKRVYNQDRAAEVTHNGITLYSSRSMVSYNGTEIELTKNELRILDTLMRRPGEIVSRDELIENLWQSGDYIDDNTLTVNVTRLRNKLADIGAKDYIVTRRGQGYMV
jgi:DNA-binding response OmpR family regulator